MSDAVASFRKRIENTTTIQDLQAVQSEITAARLPERQYSELYYGLISRRLELLRLERERTLREIDFPGDS